MASAIQGAPDQDSDKPEEKVLDYLGKPAPVSFKTQPALPTTGPIGVAAGPVSGPGGVGVGRARRPTLPGQSPDDITNRLRELFGLGGGEEGNAFDVSPTGQVTGPAGGASPTGNITGFDPDTIGNAISTALAGVPFGPLAGQAAKLGLRAGGVPPNLTAQTPQGPTSVVPAGRAQTGLLGPAVSILAGLFGIPVPTVRGSVTNVAGVPGFHGLTPAQMTELQNAPPDALANAFLEAWEIIESQQGTRVGRGAFPGPPGAPGVPGGGPGTPGIGPGMPPGVEGPSPDPGSIPGPGPGPNQGPGAEPAVGVGVNPAGIPTTVGISPVSGTPAAPGVEAPGSPPAGPTGMTGDIGITGVTGIGGEAGPGDSGDGGDGGDF